MSRCHQPNISLRPRPGGTGIGGLPASGYIWAGRRAGIRCRFAPCLILASSSDPRLDFPPIARLIPQGRRRSAPQPSPLSGGKAGDQVVLRRRGQPVARLDLESWGVVSYRPRLGSAVPAKYSGAGRVEFGFAPAARPALLRGFASLDAETGRVPRERTTPSASSLALLSRRGSRCR